MKKIYYQISEYKFKKQCRKYKKSLTHGKYTTDTEVQHQSSICCILKRFDQQKAQVFVIYVLTKIFFITKQKVSQLLN